MLLMTAAALAAPVPTGGSGVTVARVPAGAGISVRLPRGWHLVRRGLARGVVRGGWTYQPAVLASFPATFARRPCTCANPNYRTCGVWCEEQNIREFPRAGAIVFVWEFPIPPNPADLGRRYGRRPARFTVAQHNPRFAEVLARELRRLGREAGHACVEGPGSLPSWFSDFREAGRALQLEVFLGPAAGRKVRARMDALLDSLKVTPLRSR